MEGARKENLVTLILCTCFEIALCYDKEISVSG